MEPNSKARLNWFCQRRTALYWVKQASKTLFEIIAIGERNWTWLFWNKMWEGFYTMVWTSGKILEKVTGKLVHVIRPSVFSNCCFFWFPYSHRDWEIRTLCFSMITFQSDRLLSYCERHSWDKSCQGQEPRIRKKPFWSLINWRGTGMLKPPWSIWLFTVIQKQLLRNAKMYTILQRILRYVRKIMNKRK